MKAEGDSGSIPIKIGENSFEEYREIDYLLLATIYHFGEIQKSGLENVKRNMMLFIR